MHYLLADMTLGGNAETYRTYATEEKDPDSREAIRLWDLGARVVNRSEFERKWLTNPHGKDGKVLRIVLRGSSRSISGNEVLLSSDQGLDQSKLRPILIDLMLGADPGPYQTSASGADPNPTEALRCWTAGCRAVNADWFAAVGSGPARRLVYRGTDAAADGARVILDADFAHSETNVRYFMADMALGGSVDLYRQAAEVAHEMGCLEAVRRIEEGFKITNLDPFERKQVDGNIIISRKGSNQRIIGMEVTLSSEKDSK